MAKPNRLFKKIFLFFAIGYSISAYSFPEMTTHGYVNCSSCHVSPSGSGLMTEYGREISKELLSTFSTKSEDELLYGAVKTPKWLLAGGDVRVIQTYINDKREKGGDFFLMQADLAAAIRTAKWTIAAALGIKGGPEEVKDSRELTSRTHYIAYNVRDEISLRAGRFMPQYGINDPNHTIVTRQGLGFNEDMESYNLEGAYLGERMDLFVTGIFGRPDDKSLHRQTGVALSSSFNFYEKNKVGVSALRGENETEERWLAGLWGILGLSKSVFLMSEFDHQWFHHKDSNLGSTNGMSSYQRLGYVPYKGIQIYASHQLSYLDFNQLKTRIDAFGPGLNFFPRPHIELRAEYLRERMMIAGNDYFDYGWLLLHYYF